MTNQNKIDVLAAMDGYIRAAEANLPHLRMQVEEHQKYPSAYLPIAKGALDRQLQKVRDVENVRAAVAELIEAAKEVERLCFEPAGLTPEIIANKAMFHAFIAESESRVDSARNALRAALAKVTP
jgi:hypothetical protein